METKFINFECFHTGVQVKVRITAEMEATLGEDAWAAQLLARLLQVPPFQSRRLKAGSGPYSNVGF
jgi:hypothetical protein